MGNVIDLVGVLSLVVLPVEKGLATRERMIHLDLSISNMYLHRS